MRTESNRFFCAMTVLLALTALPSVASELNWSPRADVIGETLAGIALHIECREYRVHRRIERYTR
jgi:hypothetical protein